MLKHLLELYLMTLYFFSLFFENVTCHHHDIETHKVNIPTISFQNLKKKLLMKNDGTGIAVDILDTGGSLSAFAITEVLPTLYPFKLRDLRLKAPECISNDRSVSDLPTFTLADGSHRTTFATDGQKDFPVCIKKEAGVINDTFNIIDEAVSKLIEIYIGSKPLGYNVNGHLVKLVEAPYKDHLHVYHRSMHNNTNYVEFMIPFHVDNGLYLLVTPFPELGLLLKSSNGQTISTDNLGPGSVLVLIGRALTDWMMSPTKLFTAALHAVPRMSNKMEYRTIYSRMKVAPLHAFPLHNHGTKNRTFNDFFLNQNNTKTGYDSQLCLFSDNVTMFHDVHFDTAMKGLCSTENEEYCWMGCYPLPNECPNLKDAVCYDSFMNVTCNNGINEDIHGETEGCKWECKSKIKDNFQHNVYNEFCNGRMGMLMFGFEQSGNKNKPCIILFVRAWTLDTRAKFYVGCMGVFILGILIEVCIAFRRRLIRYSHCSNHTQYNGSLCITRHFFVFIRALILLVFGINLFLGYLAMLVAMTYSLELFFCVLLGIIAGHGIFNVKAAVGDSIDPCCIPLDQTNKHFLIEDGAEVSELKKLEEDSHEHELEPCRPPTLHYSSKKCCNGKSL